MGIHPLEKHASNADIEIKNEFFPHKEAGINASEAPASGMNGLKIHLKANSINN